MTTRVISAILCAASILPAATSLTEQGIAAFNEGRFSEALSILTEAAKTSDNLETQTFLALTQAAQTNCDAATPQLQTTFKSSDLKLRRIAGLALAKCGLTSEKTDDAGAVLLVLSRQFPADPDVLYLTAKYHMQAFNDTAYAMFQKTASSYRVHQLSGEVFETENRFSDAAAEYRKAIELNPSAADLHYRVGRALLMESHSPKALEDAAQQFELELKTSPEDAPSEFELGQIASAQGNTELAQKHYERASALSPTFVEPMISLGKLYCREKQYGQAIQLLSRASKLRPDSEAVHYTLMTAYRDSGDLEKAKQESAVLNRLQKPPEGEFTEFLKRLGENQPKQ